MCSVTTKVLLAVLSFLFPLAVAAEGFSSYRNDVRLHYDMVEAGLLWLDLLSQRPAHSEAKAYFMEHVVPTAGCRILIRHQKRFMSWDEIRLYDFVMEALGKKQTRKRKNDTRGNQTLFGRRADLWKQALKNRIKLGAELEKLKRMEILLPAVSKARKYLPEDTWLQVDLHFVLFGHSTAFSVGRENGIDFLQLPRDTTGKLDVRELVVVLAHELHHSGFDHWQKRTLRGIDDTRIVLAGLLAGEGIPTYFIDRPYRYIRDYAGSTDPLIKGLAKDWDRHSRNLPALYQKAAADISAGLTGNIQVQEILEEWVAGIKGAAYVLGCDMIRMIDTYLGRDAVLTVVRDYRQLLDVYNRAAQSAGTETGETRFLFSAALCRKLARYNRMVTSRAQ